METVNKTSLNGSSPKGSWLARATWSFDGADLTVRDAGWIDTEHPEPVTVAVPEVAAPPGVDQRSWSPPENFEADRARLETEITAAKARAAEAKVRVAICDAKIQAALGVEFDAWQESLAEMERQHELAVQDVRAAAQAEVERILAEARVHDAC